MARYEAAEVKVRGKWLPAVLDTETRQIVSYEADPKAADRMAGKLNARAAA